jgi:fatty-acid desaturase
MHRTHHKHVDHEDDPYNIREGLFQAHIGWLLFKLNTPPPFDNVIDLQKDRLVMWQHRYIHWIGATVAFALPAAIGYAWAAAQLRWERFLSREWRVWYFFNTAPSVSTRFATISANRHIRASTVRATRG